MFAVSSDANVFIELCGEKEGQPVNTGRAALSNSKNNFERAQVGCSNGCSCASNDAQQEGVCVD